ncbi:unnamed protein product [Macrosiphum euphorbiae]|uniref:BTB domain-containing protein n=1 Tax=Macrosiphum euphorbiae TaxID=13131 RepID=A0AAV0XAX5_9HEMI|nr:unnamed protein product [Macrosiphum euphorbiae]
MSGIQIKRTGKAARESLSSTNRGSTDFTTDEYFNNNHYFSFITILPTIMYRFMAPDITIYVMSSNNRFRAFISHRELLAQYSGYFKSLQNCETNKVFFPNINDDTFSIILSYIYTGVLKINNENIHSVLLATHTLHMPQASDMCRQFLVTQDQNIIKPIAKLPSFVDASVIQQPNENRTLKISEESNFKPPIRKENIILDIASCDGPVQFYRVLNENYKGDERRSTLKQSYNCEYCNHPFKSKYCYEKHINRHLNINMIDNKSEKKINSSIQYYPCRQCGSKFPSYYFVHKHKKYCKINMS